MPMKNGDTPAMPIELSGFGQFKPEAYAGLTKREMIAMHTMQGLLSDQKNIECHDTANDWVKNITESSVEFADALLEELEK